MKAEFSGRGGRQLTADPEYGGATLEVRSFATGGVKLVKLELLAGTIVLTASDCRQLAGELLEQAGRIDGGRR